MYPSYGKRRAVTKLVALIKAMWADGASLAPRGVRFVAPVLEQ